MLLESTIEANIENNFWSQDTLALNILLGKLEKSSKSTKAIQSYFSKRAQIEEEYGNQLLELSESSHQIEECFGALLTSSEMSARAHIDLSQNMRNMVELPLQSYVTDQENIKLFMTNQMKESQNMKMSQIEHIDKARNQYVEECQNPNASFESIDVLDREYQKSIHDMQMKSAPWIHEWRESCKTFQSVELQRMDYLRAVIKTYSSMIACTANIDDQTCERLSITMEDLDVNHEMMSFVKGHRTGSNIPAFPKYRKFNQAVDKRKHVISPPPPPPIFAEKRTIREINIPIKQDEELRSVNDQLRKKVPTNPWEYDDNDDNNSYSGNVHPYPLNPIYKSSRKSPSQSDPVLNNWYNKFQASSNTTATSPTSPTPKNKSTLVTPHEKAKYIQHVTNNNAPTKKPSLLLSSIGFFKKKKESTHDNPRNKKRLSLSHAATDSLIPTTAVEQQQASRQQMEQPPSPMFSPIDFYYSPADIDRNLKKAASVASQSTLSTQ